MAVSEWKTEKPSLESDNIRLPYRPGVYLVLWNGEATERGLCLVTLSWGQGVLMGALWCPTDPHSGVPEGENVSNHTWGTLKDRCILAPPGWKLTIGASRG